MPKTKEQKQEALQGIKDKIDQSKSVIFSADKGLPVKTIEALRNELKSTGGEYLVIKKTLLKKALADLEGVESIDNLEGNIAATFSFEDEISAVSVLNKYVKANENLEMGSGVLESKIIMPEMVKKLANLPSKEQLLAKLVGTMQAPISGIVGVLQGNLRNLVGVLNAVKEKK
ncbi:50S ribosomal protein L10 [Candidatus Nomurabacteria bacterium]|nr:50S ribosomal protein L10 [Candidatus Nomurabacteria bacterium]